MDPTEPERILGMSGENDKHSCSPSLSLVVGVGDDADVMLPSPLLLGSLVVFLFIVWDRVLLACVAPFSL